MKVLPAAVVDALPIRLWEPGNLYLGCRLHFCTSAGEPSVRNVEWNGEEVARGRRPIDLTEWDARWT